MTGNHLDNVLKDGQKIYCKTKEEVEYFMDIAEAKCLLWSDGREPRYYYDGFPIIYSIDCTNNNKKILFDIVIDQQKINESIPAIYLRNYAISVRLKRGDTHD